jgi:acyl-CoA synthetase (AMP-forming)/AMP-acid ligase II
MNLADLLSERAAAGPDSPGVLYDEEPIGIGRIEAAAWTIAALLRDHGLKPGDVVGLLLRDPLLHLVAIFALARYGIVHLPLQPRASDMDNETILGRIGAIAIVTDLERAAAPPRRAILLDAGLVLGAHAEPDPGLRHDRANLPFAFKTSSGTTSAAKLIGVTHEAAIAAMARVQAGIGHLPGERFFTPVGLHSDGPRRRTMTCLVSGGVAVLRTKPLDAPTLLDMIDRLHIQHFGCLPNQAMEMLEVVEASAPCFPDMRCFRLSAAPSDDRLRQLVRQRLCPNLVISYGCSELGPVTSAGPDEVARSPGTVGYALPGIAIEVVDEAGQPVPRGASGEVRLRAAGMVLAYHDDAAATARHFRDGWFYPGDLGVLATDGELKLLGRADDVMIFDGLKIAPFEIEAVLLQHPAVREAAAFPLRSDRSFQLPAAAVVLSAQISPRELMEFARARMGDRRPLTIFAVRQMPRNAAGKILKRELAAFAEKQISGAGSR